VEKVLLTKEQAEALESAFEICGGSKANVVDSHITEIWDGKQAELNKVDLNTLCTALYVGYEVEPGPEDRVLEIYNSHPTSGYTRKVISEVLDAYDIKVKGINC
jgi:hypothetical protein